jgi:MFS family permease
VAFGSTPFFSPAFAILGASWMGAFGWSSAQLAFGATLFLGAQTIAFPICGWLLDRLAARAVACVSIAFFGTLLIGLSLMSGSLLVFYSLMALLGLMSAATNFIAYARILSDWFDRHRGLAIGLTASAQAIGLMSIPLATQQLIDTVGWPSPLLALGCFELLVCLPSVWLLVKERSSGPVTSVPSPRDRAPTEGTPLLANILRSSVFWKLLACMTLEGLTIYAVLPNTVLILGRTAGLGVPEIAKIISLAGAAFLVGRIVFGALLDRVQARWLFLLLVALLTSALLPYASGSSIGLVRVGAFLLGAAGGGQTDLMPYVASRYFGAGSVSTVFGMLLLGFFAGAAAGPVLLVSAIGAIGPEHGLLVLAALQVIPATIFITLPGYRRRESA